MMKTFIKIMAGVLVMSVMLASAATATQETEDVQASGDVGKQRPLVGVIRWDGYNGSPALTQQQEFGFLKDE
jgi:predicted small secreted protein